MHVFTKPKSSLFISARLDHSQRIAYCVRGPAIPRRGIRQKMSLFPFLHHGRRAKLPFNITNIGKLIFRGRYPLKEGMNMRKRFNFRRFLQSSKCDGENQNIEMTSSCVQTCREEIVAMPVILHDLASLSHSNPKPYLCF